MVVKSWILPSPVLTKDVTPTPIHPPKKLTSSQVLFKSRPDPGEPQTIGWSPGRLRAPAHKQRLPNIPLHPLYCRTAPNLEVALCQAIAPAMS